MIPVQIFGLHVDPGSGASVVLLGEVGGGHEVTRVLPIFIGPAEATAIVIGLSGVQPPRPGTHDLLAEVLRIGHLELSGVEVTGLHDGAFHADLLLNTPEGPRRMSARPSDGIALAIRCGAGIAVAGEVLNDAAVPVVTFAEQFGSSGGMVVLSSDPLRKELAGLAHEANRVGPLDEGIYAPAYTAAVYEELLSRAGQLLRQGESVVLDATWQDGELRVDARAVAAVHSAELLEVRCVLDPVAAADRIRRRASAGGSASDATVAISAVLADRTDSWPEAVELPTSGTLNEVAVRVRDCLAVFRDEVVTRQ